MSEEARLTRRNRPRLARASLALLAAAAAGASPAAAAEAAPIDVELARLAARVGGTVGLAALDLGTGRRVALRGEESFPLASAVKVPIAVATLQQVERGELGLDELITVEPSDLRPGSLITERFEPRELRLTVRHLLRLSIEVSDNTATDLLLRRIGGPEAVALAMSDLGISGFEIRRTVLEAILAYDALDDAFATTPFSIERYLELVAQVSPERATAAAGAALAEANSGTPEAIVALLARLWRGEVLRAEHRELIRTAMSSAVNQRRIGGMLPPGVPPPAHKTGTLLGGGLVTAVDAGVVELPGSRGPLAIAVFVEGSTEPLVEVERSMAQISRTVVDHFLLAAGE
jgi:beta-lactamase class A